MGIDIRILVCAVALLTPILALAETASGGTPQPGPQSPESGIARRQLWHIPMPELGIMMRATVFRPKGNGPFPLVVINHGSSQNPERRLNYGVPAFPLASQWFVDRGYAVVVPQRPGHGETGGPYLEDQNGCENANFHKSGLNTAQSITATIRYMLDQPFVMKSGVIVVGQSAGGWGAVALATHNPREVRAIINFSGGRGGRAYNQDNNNCAPERLVAAAREFGKSARIPTLWLYSEGDRYFGPDLARRLAKAFGATGAVAEFRLLPAFGDYSHNAIELRDAVPVWGPIVTDFLSRKQDRQSASASASEPASTR